MSKMTYKELNKFFESYNKFKECLKRILEIDIFDNSDYFIEEIDFVFEKEVRISFYSFEKDNSLAIRIPYRLFDNEVIDKNDIKFIDYGKDNYISYNDFKKEINDNNV